MHRDDRDRNQAVAVLAEYLGLHPVECAAHREAHFGVVEMNRKKTEARIDDRYVEPEVVEPAIEQARKRAGRAIQSVARGMRPPGRARDTISPPLVRRRAIPRGLEHEPADSIGELRAGLALKVIEQRGLELGDMSVGVDYRMIQARANCRGLGEVGLHRGPS